MPRRRKSDRAKVLIVEDHPIVVRALQGLIDAQDDLVVCGAAATVADALKAAAASKPDIAVVDLYLKGASGLELLKKFRELKLPVLVLSMYDESIYAERSLRAGARGYLMKDVSTETVLLALRDILAGRLYLSEAMASRLLHLFVDREAEAGPTAANRLSEREREVFSLIGGGLGNSQIAAKLGLSVSTVEGHRAHIKEKLSLQNSTELLRAAIQWTQGMNA